MTMRLVGWAIIHSLWQGGVITLVTAGLLAATQRAKPAIRYAISLVALMLMVVLPLVSAAVSTSNASAASGSVSSFSLNLSLPETSSAPSSLSSPAPTVSAPAVARGESTPAPGKEIVLSETLARYGDIALP